MAKNKGCLTHQCFTEPCPRCGQKDKVYIGHGTVRYCDNCVISWDPAEVGQIQLETLQQAFRTDRPPVKDEDQDRLVVSIAETSQQLEKASDLDGRISRLLDISDSEWEKANGE